MNAVLILAVVWGSPFVVLAAWFYTDRLIARRKAALRLAAAEEAFWTSMAAYLDRDREDAEEQVHFGAWEREVSS